MRHITVPGFGASPCNGLVQEVIRPPAPVPAAERRSLPIVGASGEVVRGGVPVPPSVVWVCQGCGQLWEREPLPDETL